MLLIIVLGCVILFSLVMWPFILFSSKQPIAMLAWLFAVTFLPALGPLFFLTFGLGRGRWGIPRKKKRADSRIQDSLDLYIPRFHPYSEGEAEREETHPLLALAKNACAQPLTFGNQLEFLPDAASMYARLFADISAARQHIHLEYFILFEDNTGNELADLIVKKASEGVAVRLMVDGFGSWGLTSEYLSKLEKAGVQFHWFHPLNPFRRRWALNVRNHRKITVIDASVGYVGGINLGDEYLGKNPSRGEWFDLAVRMEGPAAASLQRVFAEDWHFASGEVLGEAFFQVRPPAPGGDPALILNSGPNEGSAELHQVVFTAISTAVKQAWLLTPFFIPDESLQTALVSAALRGVDVKVVITGRTASPLVDAAGQSFAGQLTDSGVPIYRFRSDAMLHAKALLVDGAFMVLGSANLDVRSFQINFETGALIQAPALAETLEQYFKTILSQSKRVPPPRELPLSSRFFQAFARLFSPLF